MPFGLLQLPEEDRVKSSSFGLAKSLHARITRGLSSGLGNFLETFEVFCDKIKAKEGVKTIAFLNSLPESVKFDMQDDDHILHSMSYDELKEPAIEVLSKTKQKNNAKKTSLRATTGFG